MKMVPFFLSILILKPYLNIINDINQPEDSALDNRDFNQRNIQSSGRQNGNSPQRRTLTDEERRRIEETRRNAAAFATAHSSRQNSPQSTQQSGQQTKTQAQTKQIETRHRRFKINVGIVIFILLVAVIIFVAVNQINKNKANNLITPPDTETIPVVDTDAPPETEPSDTSSETADTEDTSGTETELQGFHVQKQNTEVDFGNLVLVNYDHKYERADTVELTNVRANRKSNVQVSGIALSLTQQTLDAFDKLSDDLDSIGCPYSLLLNSGYRSSADQQEVWDTYLNQNGQDYVNSYVAVPWYSEHHTGLAADITFFTENYTTMPLSDTEYGTWITDNCDNYGLILRYPENKVEITRIAHEPWHFRYVGITHAKACNHLGMCFEEYTEYVKNHTLDGKILNMKSDYTFEEYTANDLPGTINGWIIYYVPASEGESTDILIPFDEASVDYEISGNNDGGFVVTVSSK